jgi:hypothetical protein
LRGDAHGFAIKRQMYGRGKIDLLQARHYRPAGLYQFTKIESELVLDADPGARLRAV